MTWLKHILQGRWLGHPLHPALVHLPTGLWPAALLFDAMSFSEVGHNALVRASFACIAGGLLGALLAIPTGLADWAEIKPGKPARRLGLYHMGLNAIGASLFALNLWLRRETVTDADSVSAGQLTLSVLGVLILLVSGYLGGRMAFEHGIGVGRMSKEKWRRLAQAGHANLPPKPG